MTRLEYTDASSNKFWEVVVEDTSRTVRYGKIGSAGTAKTESFADASAAAVSDVRFHE
ncbi:MAG: WGR domain-containing protein [Proteobacteria bacterium]|nr:WGR domain-containing protein [Pseudomonadota bacterium]